MRSPGSPWPTVLAGASSMPFSNIPYDAPLSWRCGIKCQRSAPKKLPYHSPLGRVRAKTSSRWPQPRAAARRQRIQRAVRRARPADPDTGSLGVNLHRAHGVGGLRFEATRRQARRVRVASDFDAGQTAAGQRNNLARLWRSPSQNDCQSPNASKAAAARSTIASSKRRPISIMPTGRSSTLAQGTVMAGCPETSNGHVLPTMLSASVT
jgi:hypothetical protein